MSELNVAFIPGARVYYKDEGPEDQGTVESFSIVKDDRGREVIIYQVRWDSGEDSSSPLDMTDGFYADQLELGTLPVAV